MELGFVNENRTQDAEVQYSGVHDLGLEDSGLEISVNDNSELEKYGLQDSGYRTQDTVDQGTVFEDSGAQETVFADTGHRTQDTAAHGSQILEEYMMELGFVHQNRTQDSEDLRTLDFMTLDLRSL